MRSVLFVIAISIICTACRKSNGENASPDLAGAYSGTFSRTGMADTAHVTLELGIDDYTGQSDREKYPAICKGSFMATQQSIAFIDSCAWTADFDWTIILNGTYHLSFLPDHTIKIWRDNGMVTDEYILQKRFR